MKNIFKKIAEVITSAKREVQKTEESKYKPIRAKGYPVISSEGIITNQIKSRVL